MDLFNNILLTIKHITLLQVIDMVHELRALRNQIQEKSLVSVKLQKEVCLMLS